MTTTHWTLDGREFTSDDIGDFYGFVYRITNLVNGHDYVGRKYFKTIRKLKPLMGLCKLSLKLNGFIIGFEGNFSLVKSI